MPIDARYLLGMAVAFTMFQFAPKIGHGFKAATVKVGHKLHHKSETSACMEAAKKLQLEGVDDDGSLCREKGTPINELIPVPISVNLPVPDPNSRHNPLGQ